MSPISDRDNLSINSYGRWEQAFRVYSNIITSKSPGKATELLQYNHTIHMASTTYSWDNVYSYDKEFRHHIARHPYHSWGIILQQAWTMLLKDRVKYDHTSQRNGNHKGYNRGNGNSKEICKRFNKGHCMLGLSCRYDHRCAILKCGKFSHGVHICRLRKAENEFSGQGIQESGSTTANNNNNNSNASKK